MTKQPVAHTMYTPLLLLGAVCLLGVVKGGDDGPVNVPISRDCSTLHPRAGMSPRYFETVAHAIHSMTVQGLRIFNPQATSNNNIPTVNRNISDPVRVLEGAPDVPLSKDFISESMNAVDDILSGVGRADDGLGPQWSPVERVVHNFHMWDMWLNIHQMHDKTVRLEPPADDVCACLLDVKTNGVRAAVQWVADHYSSGTPITLLNRPIPKLTGAASWGVWKERLLHYYDKQSLFEAALYINCATRNF